MTPEEQLKQVREEIKVLKSQIQEKTRRETELMISVFKQEFGIKEDDICMVGDKKCKVTSFKRKWYSIHPIVTLYNKDGSLGKRQRELYDFDTLNFQKINQ